MTPEVEFRKHQFLRERLVLKGGTAVNLFYLKLPRLSVDIDLNYIGQSEREEMMGERPEAVKATEQISQALGYKVQRAVEDYALVEWFLTYQNHTGSFDQIQVEINFLMRACALAPQLRQAISIGDETACEFAVLAIEELFAGKIKAMIDRQHPRDLYDLFRFREANLTCDSELMRKLAVLFGSTLNRDLRSYNIHLEGRRSIQVSYGRLIHSKGFPVPSTTPLIRFVTGLYQNCSKTLVECGRRYIRPAHLICLPVELFKGFSLHLELHLGTFLKHSRVPLSKHLRYPLVRYAACAEPSGIGGTEIVDSKIRNLRSL